jgi:hypothetical protein
MANHINTSVTFREISDAGKARLAELYGRLRVDPDNGGSNTPWFTDIFLDGDQYTSYQETSTDGRHNVGSKWCYFNDWYEDGFNLESAWSYPDDGVEWIFDQIAEVDPDFIATVFYEDEAYNFAGVRVWNTQLVGDVRYAMEVENHELFDTEIMELMFAEVDGLQDEWDEDEDEFTDEGWDLYHDNIGEVLSNNLSDIAESAINLLDE